MEDWEKKWVSLASGIRSDVSYTESSQVLRDLIKSGLLRFDDMSNNPERFFKAHRLLVDPVKRGTLHLCVGLALLLLLNPSGPIPLFLRPRVLDPVHRSVQLICWDGSRTGWT